MAKLLSKLVRLQVSKHKFGIRIPDEVGEKREMVGWVLALDGRTDR